jgi:hypothetical protein
MPETPRSPHPDNDLIDQVDEFPTPSQSGAAGGELAREIANRDEDKTALGGDPQPTAVHKGDKPDAGDEPSLPNRDGGGRPRPDRVPPRRS